jgi:hypothetical protein
MSTAEDARRAITQLHGMSRWGGNITVKLASGASDKVLDTITAEAQEPSDDIEEVIRTTTRASRNVLAIVLLPHMSAAFIALQSAIGGDRIVDPVPSTCSIEHCFAKNPL